MIKPTKIRIELDIELKYFEPFEIRKELESEVEGIKQELLNVIDTNISSIINQKIYSTVLKIVDRRLFFIDRSGWK